MDRTLTLVLYMAVLTWLALLVASLVRAKAWTPAGMLIAFGNRDNLPVATPIAERTARTAQNTAENFMLFAAIALVAHAAAASNPRFAAGAELFFWARVLYIPIYYAGIKFLRTAVWLVSVVGLGMMLSALA